MEIKSVNLSEFIRYILTGFNFWLFVVILPCLYFYPSILRDLIKDTSFFTALTLSVATGYLLDTMKVYQFIPRFKEKNLEFRKVVAKTLEIPLNESASYVSFVYQLWGKYSFYDIERRRSEWALALYTYIILSVSVFVWVGIVLYNYFVINAPQDLTIPILASALSLLGSARLLNVINQGRERLDQDFIIILRKNKKTILDTWKINMNSESQHEKE